MKPKTFEQKLKRDMWTTGILFLIFLAVFILAKLEIYPESHFASLGSGGAISYMIKKNGRKQKFPKWTSEISSSKNRHTALIPCFLLFAYLLPFLSAAL